MRAYKGVAFAIEEHFHRLRTSADILGLPIPNLDWPATITELLEKNEPGRQDAWVRLTITRGPAEPRVLPPDLPKPTTILMVRPLDREIAAAPEARRQGRAAALLAPRLHPRAQIAQLPARRGGQGAGVVPRRLRGHLRAQRPRADRGHDHVGLHRPRRRAVDRPRGRHPPRRHPAAGDRPGARQRHARRRARDHHDRPASRPTRRSSPRR